MNCLSRPYEVILFSCLSALLSGDCLEYGLPNRASFAGSNLVQALDAPNTKVRRALYYLRGVIFYDKDY